MVLGITIPEILNHYENIIISGGAMARAMARARTSSDIIMFTFSW